MIEDKFQEIKMLEEKLLDKWIRKHPLKVSKLLADDFIEYSSSGFICNKEKTIESLQSEQSIKFGMRDFRIQELANNVILATYIAIKYNANGIEESSSLRSSIWKLNNDTWQMTFHQGTKIEDNVILEEYNDSWLKKARDEINLIKVNCKFDWVCDIQHFGSTAIIGLKAKPIIDIMIGVKDITKARLLIPILESLGYKFWDENPKTDRMFFVKGMPPYGKRRTHHVHVFETDSYEWMARLAFRDYLNTHTDAKLAYQELKNNLAKEFLEDRETYTLSKANFVNKIVQKTTEYKRFQECKQNP